METWIYWLLCSASNFDNWLGVYDKCHPTTSHLFADALHVPSQLPIFVCWVIFVFNGGFCKIISSLCHSCKRSGRTPKFLPLICAEVSWEFKSSNIQSIGVGCLAFTFSSVKKSESILWLASQWLKVSWRMDRSICSCVCWLVFRLLLCLCLEFRTCSHKH